MGIYSKDVVRGPSGMYTPIMIQGFGFLCCFGGDSGLGVGVLWG